MPGKWKEVIHDNTVTWLATWTENINGNHKYVFLAAGSSLKGQSDMTKFEKARELKVSSLPFSSPLPVSSLSDTRRTYSRRLSGRFEKQGYSIAHARDSHVFH